MTKQQNNQSARHKALIEEVRGIAGLMEAAQDTSVVTINQVGSLLTRIVNEMDELLAGENPAGTQPELFVSILQDLAEHVDVRGLTSMEVCMRLKKLAEEMQDPDGRPAQYVESLKLGQLFVSAEMEDRGPEPLLTDFVRQLEEQG